MRCAGSAAGEASGETVLVDMEPPGSLCLAFDEVTRRDASTPVADDRLKHAYYMPDGVHHPISS